VGLDDGTIGGMVLERATPIDIPTVSARLLSPSLRMVDHRRVSGFTTSEDMRVVSTDGRAAPLQVDGDYIGDVTEAVFGVWPGALRVVA
jgi:diacylglycerol kinase family enzyme